MYIHIWVGSYYLEAEIKVHNYDKKIKCINMTQVVYNHKTMDSLFFTFLHFS